MRPNRPTSVLVIAILQFVFGGLGLFGALCTGGILAAGGAKMFSPPPAPGQQVSLQESMMKFQAEKQPYYNAHQYGSVGLELVLSTIMIAGGVGLLQMRGWGRPLTICYALLSIVIKIVSAVYILAFQLPVMKDFVAQYKPAPGQVGDAEKAMLNLMETIAVFTGVAPLVVMIYPIVILALMLRPSIAAAFRGEVVESEPEDYRDEAEDRWGR